MKIHYFTITFLIFFVLSLYVKGQDSLLVSLIEKNAYIFEMDEGKCSGNGWEYLKKEVETSQNVLIGESHLTKEVPLITKHIYELKDFDNFIIEVDPYTTEILENTIKSDKKKKDNFIAEFGHHFSFYSLQEEFALLDHIVQNGTQLIGTEQITATSDQIIFNYFIDYTSNKKAKKIYKDITEKAKEHFINAVDDPQLDKLYFMSEEFTAYIDELETMDLSEKEKALFQEIRWGKEIYTGGGIELRIKVFKHHLMKQYDKWATKKNLLKFGAMHAARGESLAQCYDIGNFIANITDSQFKESFHLAIFGESGTVGSPYTSMPPSEVSTEDWPVNCIKEFFEFTNDKDYYVFNLTPLRKKIYSGKLVLDNSDLERLIKGYDALIIAPEFSPASFLNE